MSTTKAQVMTFLLIGALSGCMTDSQTTDPPTITANTVDLVTHRQMNTDSQYMLHVLEKSAGVSGSIRVDLSDPLQYRFVMGRLAAAGKTAENSPELFSRLQNSRDKAVALATAGTITTSAASTDWCAAKIQLGSEQRVNSSIVFPNSHPIVSCVGGASYVYADITTYNANAAGTELFVVQSAAGEDYSGGTNFTTLNISPAIPAIVGRVNKTDSLVIAYDDYGNEQMAYNVVSTYIAPVIGGITLEHPRLHTWIDNKGKIQICQLRGSPTQCDYGVVSLVEGVLQPFLTYNGAYTGMAAVEAETGTPSASWQGDPATYLPFESPYIPNDLTHVYVLAEGVADAGAKATGDNCIISSIEKAEWDLIKEVSGGICTTRASFKDKVVFNPGSRTAYFNTVIDFGNNGGIPGQGAGDCSYSRIINESVKTYLRVSMKTSCGMRHIALGMPEHLEFLNSCFAKGTRIRRADGSSTAVESLKVGDKVTSDVEGTALTVVGTSHGSEAEPLVALRDNKGHMLRLTAKHPVVKASGDVVFASAIQKNDGVMTDRGVASIVSVARIPYTGQVYSLKLGTPEEQAKVGKNRTTMFAGGFLVGDSAMQQDHDKPHYPIAQLSKAWARDYQNALASNPPMPRILR